jgi:hypothetical protein
LLSIYYRFYSRNSTVASSRKFVALPFLVIAPLAGPESVALDMWEDVPDHQLLRRTIESWWMQDAVMDERDHGIGLFSVVDH